MPLRFTLVGAVLLLSALGLLASGVAVTSALENSLTNRVDHQLHDAAQGWAKPGESRPLPPPVEPNLGRPPSPFYVRRDIAERHAPAARSTTNPCRPPCPTIPRPGR